VPGAEKNSKIATHFLGSIDIKLAQIRNISIENNFPKWPSHLNGFPAIFGLFQPSSAKLGYLCQFFRNFNM